MHYTLKSDFKPVWGFVYSMCLQDAIKAKEEKRKKEREEYLLEREQREKERQQREKEREREEEQVCGYMYNVRR